LRIFAFEYVTAGGWREIGAAPSLIAEGAAMLRALVRDLARLPAVEVVVAADPELALAALDADAVTIDPSDLRGSWRRIAGRCDLLWPIAPETGGLLEEMARLATAAGCEPLCSRSAALAIARSKTATARWLAERGIPVVATHALEAAAPTADRLLVVKPDDGAGAVDTVLVAGEVALARWRHDDAARGFVVQPFVLGEPLSISLLAQDGEAWLLCCNRQDVAIVDDRFFYRGSVVGGAEDRRAALAPLAQSIAAALPDLWGYVGVDLIDGREGPAVLEINPRLTTSYVGLADSIGINPAELVLALREHPLAELVRPLAPRAVPIAVNAP
jgi:tyramine---L-glutamate ligase